MIPTFIIDWPVIILIGLIFGYGIKGTPSKSFFLTRAFMTGKFVLTLFIIIVYYSYLLAPDWMWMYFVADKDLPRWMVFYVLILYYFAYLAGFALTIEGAKFSRFYPPFLMVLMVIAEVAVVLGLKARYLVVGTLEEFQAGQALPLAESTVGTIPAILSALLIPLGIVLIIWSRREKF